MTSESPEGLPPSCLFVQHLLRRDGPLSPRDLIDKTGLPPQTVHYALDRLDSETDALEREPDPGDGRQFRYNI